MPQADDIDPNESCIVTLYGQPDGSGDYDWYSLPKLASTRDEALSIISRLPRSAHVHYMVMRSTNHHQPEFFDPEIREYINKRQIEAAKEEIAEFEEVRRNLNYAANRDPTQVAVRDRYVARHAFRIDVLKYMVCVGERLAFVPENQCQPRAQAQQPNGAPPPYSP